MLIFAHRGASGRAPDNTIKAFNLAMSMGTTAIESDVKRTLDGKLVFFHDYTAKILGGRVSIPVIMLTHRLLAKIDVGHNQRVPSIPETFEYYRKKGILDEITWSLDLPDNFTIRKFAHTCKQFGIEKNIHACNTKPRILSSWSQMLPDSTLVWSIRKRQLDDLGPLKAVRLARSRGIHVVNVKCDDIVHGIEKQVRTHGLDLYIWDVHDERRYKKAMAYKPDAIYTNYPGMVLSGAWGS